MVCNRFLRHILIDDEKENLNPGNAEMWEPYAALRNLGKAVDLLVLNSEEHVLSNPTTRMALQGGTVDWFRFWLQDYEDPDPAKADQYARWRELRKVQRAETSDQKPN